MKKISLLSAALIATLPALSQQTDSREAMGNTKVNTDFSKYKTFTWAKSDPTMVGPNGYEIYFYEIYPDRSRDLGRTDDMNRNRDLDRTEDMDRNRDLDRTEEDKAYDKDKTQRDPGYNSRDKSTDPNRTTKTDQERAASDRATDRDQTYNQDKSTDKNRTTDPNRPTNPNQADDRNYNKQTEDPSNPRRTDTYQNPNKPSGYVYSYTMIIPARDAATNETIRESISNELEGRGFRESGSSDAANNSANNTDNNANSSTSADLIVAYQVLDQKATLRGFNNDDPVKASGQEVRQPSDTATFVLEPGSLIVSLIDSETSEMVWHGWASGLIDNRSFSSDEAELKEAVHKIFEQFKHTADKAKKD